MPEPGETAGFSPEQHLEVLSSHAPSLTVHAILADTVSVPLPDRLHRAAAVMLAPGGRVRLAAIAEGGASTPRHDPDALADCLVEMVGSSGHAARRGSSDQAIPHRSGAPGRGVVALGEET